MSVLLLAFLTAVADEPTCPVVVELDNVCGRDCVAILEKALAKIDGVKSAEMYGDKFHFLLQVLDTKVVLPSAILKVVEKIKADSKGEEDFPLISFEATLAGTVDGTTFTARGSGQKYGLKSNDALKALLAAGKTKLTLTGKVSEAKGPVLDVSEAKESPK
jgi:copper chaperone CopZ